MRVEEVGVKIFEVISACVVEELASAKNVVDGVTPGVCDVT